MGILDFEYVLTHNSGAVTSQPWYDGTYIWFTTRALGTNYKYLWRMRVSDKQLIKPDGTVGDGTNAGVYFDGYPLDSFCMSDGTSVLVGSYYGGGVRRYSASDMTLLDTIGDATGIGMDCDQGTFDGTYFWLTGNYQGAVIQGIWRITPGTWAVSKIESSLVMSAIQSDGTNLWVHHRSSAAGIKKINKTTGATILTVSDLTSSPFLGMDLDRGEMWTALGNAECARFRLSDGAWLNPDGTVGTLATSTVSGENVTASGGVGVFDGHVYVSATAAYFEIQRRWIRDGVGLPQAGYFPLTAGLPAGFRHSLRIGNTVYFTLGATGGTWGKAGLMWCDISDLAAAPNLIDVSPGAGPHISLTFDNPVGIIGPALGPSVEGILVTGATQVAPAQIDLALTAAGTPPAAPIGSATNDTGPEAPSGGAVTSDPTPAVPVAGAFRRPT